MLFLNAFKIKSKISNMNIMFHQSFKRLKTVVIEDVPMSEVTTATIKRKFKENGIIYEDGFTCFIIRCSFCGQENKSKIYVNKTTGINFTLKIFFNFLY